MKGKQFVVGGVCWRLKDVFVKQYSIVKMKQVISCLLRLKTRFFNSKRGMNEAFPERGGSRANVWVVAAPRQSWRR